jgi:hypothetical protein
MNTICSYCKNVCGKLSEGDCNKFEFNWKIIEIDENVKNNTPAVYRK